MMHALAPSVALYQLVQSLPNQHNPDQCSVGAFPMGDGFGFVFCFDPYEKVYFRKGVEKQAGKMKAKPQ